MLAGTELTEREIHALMLHYEGLVMRTAQMLSMGDHPDLRGRGPVEMDEDDIRQLLRLKVFKAITRFDPSRVRSRPTTGRQRYGSVSPLDKARDGYVNMCVRDQVKDIVKKKRHGDLMIEDIAPRTRRGGAFHDSDREKFEHRYLSTEHDEVFAEVEDELPELPDTLSDRERAVLALLFREYRQPEIALSLGITKREVESAVRSLRKKMTELAPQAA